MAAAAGTGLPHPTRAMTLVTFTDSHGTRWDVWNVTSYVLRGTDRRQGQDDGAWDGPERRGGGSDALVPDPQAGWLCFQSAGEKRRLAPVPQGWIHFGPAQMERLLERAATVGRRPSRG